MPTTPKKKVVKKKKTTTKAARPEGLLPAGTGFADSIKLLRDALRTTAERFVEEADEMGDGDEMPQDMIAAACYFPELADLLKQVGESSGLAARKARLGDGFDKTPVPGHGLGVVAFPVTKGQLRPKWQEKAVEAAQALAEAKGEAFDEEVYIAGVKKATTRGKDSEKVAFTFAE